MTRGFEIAKGFEEKDIELPIRKTKTSAGYDFEAADDIVIPSIWKLWISKLFVKEVTKVDDNSSEKDNKLLKPVLVPTGIKAYMGDDEVLKLYNRSSNPLKLFLMLANAVGIIDSDYYNNPDNDGHIQFQFINFGFTDRVIKKHDRIGQGIFVKYLKADEGAAREEEEIRAGGFGSTK